MPASDPMKNSQRAPLAIIIGISDLDARVLLTQKSSDRQGTEIDVYSNVKLGENDFDISGEVFGGKIDINLRERGDKLLLNYKSIDLADYHEVNEVEAVYRCVEQL